MDTSKEYIRMCNKATDIQKLWEPQEGDWLTPGLIFDKNNQRNVMCLSSFNWVKGDDCWKVLQYWHVRFFIDDNAKTDYFWDGTEILTYKKFRNCPFDWIPRQDQLQEMVFKSGVNFNFGEYEKFIEFIFPAPSFLSVYCDNFNTMEQIWLGFVMQEKYSKKWNGTDWVEVRF